MARRSTLLQLYVAMMTDTRGSVEGCSRTIWIAGRVRATYLTERTPRASSWRKERYSTDRSILPFSLRFRFGRKFVLTC